MAALMAVHYANVSGMTDTTDLIQTQERSTFM